MKISYHPVSKFFHWSMALLMLGMLLLTEYIEDFPKELRGFGFMLHKSTGLLILVMLVGRIVWRFRQGVVASHVPHPLIAWMAKIVHFFLYLAMFAMPITGWIFASRKHPLTFFDLFDVPYLVGADATEIKQLAHKIHTNLPDILLIVIALHVIGALWHHFILKDNTLKKMI